MSSAAGRRQRVEELLARQHGAKSRGEFVRLGLEILYAVTGIPELEPGWKPSPTIRPLPTRKNIETMEDLVAAKQTMAEMVARGQGSSDEYAWLYQQVRANEGIITDRAQRGAA